jgi:hypothetical protein
MIRLSQKVVRSKGDGLKERLKATKAVKRDLGKVEL